jgi:hypothetical protein
MLLTLDMQTLQPVGGFRVVKHPVSMAALGTVWQLTP